MPTTGVSRVVDFEKLIEGKLPNFLSDYYATGGGDEQTLTDSIQAFKRFRLIPRILRSKHEINTEAIVQGKTMDVPFGISPTGFQSGAHPMGGIAPAKAAEKAGAIMIVSSWNCFRFESIASSAPGAVLWLQMYPFLDRRNTVNYVRRAERNGYQAIVLTVDSPQVGIFDRSIRSGKDAQAQFGEFLPNGLINFEACPGEISRAKSSGDKYLFQYAQGQQSNPADWEYIAWIRTLTKLPIILKGILTEESAREAVAAGVQGIIVSAHGGRQLDGVQAPVEALPAIVDALQGSKIEVYMDGGVRSGRDVFKALAIGAKAVFIGRPIIWGLAHNGEEGVSEILGMIKKELTNTMSLAVPTIQKSEPYNMPTTGVSRIVDFEKLIEGKLPNFLNDYYSTGAGDEHTLTDSIRAFKRFRLIPRVLRSKHEINTEAIVQGKTMNVPFGICPTALQLGAHPMGDVATARAAEKAGTIMIVSCWSCVRFESLASSAPGAVLWLQMYPFLDRRNTVNFVRRAERNGYQAIVVTVDSPQSGIFTRSVRSGKEGQAQFGDILPNGLPNYEACPEETTKAKASGDKYLFQYALGQQSNPADWEYIAWIRTLTKLPIILKGILTEESAREAVAAGVQGIIVSAHGGRQLDGVQAPIEALPAIVDALQGSKVEVYMDGGVRSGRDVFKALAIGAKAVFIGRPIIWGLAHNGEEGVSEILGMIKKELTNTMSLAGCNKIDEITRSSIKHESQIKCKL